MRNLKRLATSLVALVLVLAFSSCEKQQPQSSKIDVSFDIADLTSGLSKKGALETGDPSAQNIEKYPECTELTTDYVIVTIDGVAYTLEMTSLPNSQTEVVQLDADAPNEVQSLVVFSSEQKDPIYIAPKNTSLEVTEGGLTGVPFTINTEAWNKEAIHVDVVCWHPYTYKPYTWNWFQIDYHQVKSICFFGDVCTKFYEEFGAEGYDFPAAFTVALTYQNSAGAWITNTLSTNDDENFVNENGPLCISYLDDLMKDEHATYTLTLNTPTGDVVLDENVAIAEGTWSEEGKSDGFGGMDGIYLFNVGECGIDEEGQFASYLPLPTTAKMKVGVNSSDDYNITISENGEDLHMLAGISGTQAWCLDHAVNIHANQVYTARVFSSLDLAKLAADPNITQPRKDRFSSFPWGAINYMINNLDELPLGLTPADLQHAFWYISNGYQNVLPAVKAKIDEWKDSSNPNNKLSWKPKVGDDAVVFLIPDQKDKAIQAFGVRIDP
jgi:hypothetical protein